MIARALAALAVVTIAGCGDAADSRRDPAATGDPRPAGSAPSARPVQSSLAKPVVLGPAPAGAGAPERERAVYDLLAGGAPATELPLVDTDRGKPFDPALLDRIARPLKPAQLRAGAIKVEGGLPPEVVSRIVRQNFGRFRLCYDNARKDKPDLAVKLVLKWTIAADGSVKDPKDGGSDVAHPKLVECALKAVLGLSFPQPERGEVKVTYPIELKPPS